MKANTHKRLNGFAEYRSERPLTEPVKFAVVIYGKVITVFAYCKYEAVGIATEDPNLNEHYPLCFDGYVYACNLDEDVYEDPDTYDGYKHPDDSACSTFEYDTEI